MGVVELNAAQLAALVLVDIPVMTMGASDVSKCVVVMFDPSILEVVVEKLIVTPLSRCLVISASSSLQDLFQLCL